MRGAAGHGLPLEADGVPHRQRPAPVKARDLLVVRLLKTRGKTAFLQALPPGARLLDVGCGNDSPRNTKRHRPDVHYIGLDVADFNQSQPVGTYADEYVVTMPERFPDEIRRHEGTLDAVISSHNLEHCNEPERVLDAMLRALKRGGRLYLSFPCEESVDFPKRRGCLNFHDDSTHNKVPDWSGILSRIAAGGFLIDYAAKRYRPLLLATIGALLEPASALEKRVMPLGSTWALYGFESVIWARAAP